MGFQVVVCTAEMFVSEEAVAHLREVAPHAEYTDIADATHMVVGDANDAFSNAILGFLNRHHGPTGSGQ